MFRKLTAAAALGFGVLSASPIPAGAADAPTAGPLHPAFEVWVRADHHHPWRLHGVFPSSHAAHDTADRLRHHGYEVRIDSH